MAVCVKEAAYKAMLTPTTIFRRAGTELPGEVEKAIAVILTIRRWQCLLPGQIPTGWPAGDPVQKVEEVSPPQAVEYHNKGGTASPASECFQQYLFHLPASGLRTRGKARNCAYEAPTE